MERDFRIVAAGAARHPETKSAEGALRRNDTSFPLKLTAKLRALYDRYLEARAAVFDPPRPLREESDVPPGAVVAPTEEQRVAALLKYYQYIAREYMNNPEYGVGPGARGLLIYHEMGMGKTILAAGVCLAAGRPAVAVLPKALHENFVRAVEFVIKNTHPELVGEDLVRAQREALKKIQFISMDAYNMADQLGRVGQPHSGSGREATLGETGALDNKLLVVDEAHNLFRAIINSSNEKSNARRLYDMVQEARDLRIIFLTGTPASKDPFELVPCFNMLAGRDLLPPTYETFYQLYIDKEKRKVKNRDKLINRLAGLVSHVSPRLPTSPPQGKEGAAVKAPREDGGFPEKLPLIIDRVEMGPDQYRQYRLAREKEEAEGKRGEFGGPRAESASSTPPLSLPGAEKKAMRSYYVKSRSLSNFAPPREWAAARVADMPDEVFDHTTGPKIAKIVDRIDTLPGPALAYSQFVDVGGLKVIARFLRKRGYTAYYEPAARKAIPKIDAEKDPGELDDIELEVPTEPEGPELPPTVESLPFGGVGQSPPPLVPPLPPFKDDKRGGAEEIPPEKRYAIISGETPKEMRDKIQDVFNSQANRHGEIIRGLLVSKTGAEGLDLKWVRQTHVTEPYWDKAREDQFEDRGARLGSHDGLPREEREIQPFLYISTVNRARWLLIPEKNRETKTIDETFHERALVRYELNKDARLVLRSASLECLLFGYGDCLSCVPTGVPLFHDDPSQDVRLPNPCEQHEQKSLAAKKIIVRRPDETTAEYFYVEAPAELFGYKFYSLRSDLGGYAEVEPSDPMVPELLEAVGKLQ